MVLCLLHAPERHKGHTSLAATELRSVPHAPTQSEGLEPERVTSQQAWMMNTLNTLNPLPCSFWRESSAGTKRPTPSEPHRCRRP